ncbi:MAG: LysR family transcriptional regulator [Cypionkella sp.]
MQTRFTLRQLEYLVAVGRFGSISKAADHLAVSPPSISNAIAQLEAEFGLPMFVRKHAQGMALTQVGRELMQQAATVLEATKRFSDLADLRKGTVRGDLNVGCLLTFAQIIVPRLRKAYTQTYPEVVFRQFQNHQMGLIEQLRDASIDIALTYDLAIPTDLEFVELATLPPFVIFSESHPLAHRSSVSVEDLATSPMILLDLPLSSAYFLSFFEKAGVTPRIVERTQDMAVLLSLVGNDFGFSIINIKPLSDKAPDGKTLRFVPLTGPVKPTRMGLLCAPGAKSSLTVQAFVDLCAALLTEDVLSQVTMRAHGEEWQFPPEH